MISKWAKSKSPDGSEYLFKIGEVIRIDYPKDDLDQATLHFSNGGKLGVFRTVAVDIERQLTSPEA